MWAAFTETTSPSCGRPRAISASSSTTPTSRAFTVCEGGTCYERDTSPGPGPGGVPALRRLYGPAACAPDREAGGEQHLCPGPFEAPFGRADARLRVRGAGLGM